MGGPNIPSLNMGGPNIRSLSSGFNIFLPLGINIPGTVGFNAIDDSFTNDPFNNALSPHGSIYYLGDVNQSASEPPVLRIFEMDFNPIGFGADWVVDGELFMEVQGTAIPFDAYLPSGSGFLGVITRPTLYEAHLSGTAVFGLDNFFTAQIPEPSSIALALLTLLGLAIRRTRRAPSFGRY